MIDTSKNASRLPWLAAVLIGLAVLLLTTSGQPAPLAHGAFPGLNGKIAFTSNRDGNAEIYTMKDDGTMLANITNNPATDSGAAWSADGTMIAFVSDRDGNPEIYRMNADGTGVVRLTTNSANDGSPGWSPDGSKITFARSAGARSGAIFTMNSLDGSGEVQITFNLPLAFPSDIGPVWSPDGTKISFYRSNNNSNQEICTINSDGTGPVPCTTNGQITRYPNWSPDGSSITFDQGPAGTAHIWRMAPNFSSPLQLSSGPIDEQPAWSPDGTKIVFTRFNFAGIRPSDIVVMNADGTGLVNLTNHPTSGVLIRDNEADWGPAPQADTTPPTITPPADVTVECDTAGGISGSNPAKQAFLNGATATDNIDPNPVVTNDAPPFCPLGATVVTFTATDASGNSASASATITVVDTTAPTVTAALVPVTGDEDDDESLFQVVFSCSDTCDANPTVTSATVNGVPVTNGQVVALELDDEIEVGTEDGIVEIEAPSFELVVTCTDASGNVGTAIASPAFPSDEDDSDDDSSDDDSGDYSSDDDSDDGGSGDDD